MKLILEGKWKLFNNTGDGTVILYDATRKFYARLSSKDWFLKTPEYLDFWFTKKVFGPQFDR